MKMTMALPMVTHLEMTHPLVYMFFEVGLINHVL
jgi:hypothetical protein